MAVAMMSPLTAAAPSGRSLSDAALSGVTRCSCPICAACDRCARLSALSPRHVPCRLHGAQPGDDAVTCPRCCELGRRCHVHLTPTAAPTPSQSPKITAAPAPVESVPTAAPASSQSPSPARVERPETQVQHDLRQVLLALEPVEAFERGRYGNGLKGWVSDADGSHREEEVARARETEAMAALLAVDDETDARWPLAAAAREKFLRALMESPIQGDREDRDPQWERAREHQRRLRELESHAATAIPAAVLRLMCATATANSSLREVCERAGESFASPALKGRWAADAAPKPKGDGKVGRPKKDRSRPAATVGRLALGRELVLWALAVWEGRPWTAPAWVPREYRPPVEKTAEVA